jgi:alanine racemase
MAPKAEILPMVKADAYGNGLIPISRFLTENCGAKTLGCASLGEALFLKKELPHLTSRMIIFSDTELSHREGRNAYVNKQFTPVIHQKSDLELILRAPELKATPLVLKVNTGMNRLGLSQQDLESFLPELRNRGIEHLMTHFARSATLLKKDDKTYRQYEEFLRLKKILSDAGVSIEKTSVANSGAIEQSFGVDESYVRPGIMLYGPPSVTEPVLWTGKQISRWVTKVMSSFFVKKGTPVGYGVNVVEKDSFMVVLPIGYGDGFLTYFSGASLSINGIKGKIFGRINMDMAFVQFDPEAQSQIKNNDMVEVWGHDNRQITELAAQSKTHAYQIMCAVSGRIPRIYKVK